MGFRTVIITNSCKLSYNNDYLVIRGEELKMVHLSEINTILIDSTMVTITVYLITEFIKHKIKVIFCDEQRNPSSELIPYYGSHNTSKRVSSQIEWDNVIKSTVWTNIVKQKIFNQAQLLKRLKKDEHSLLDKYYSDVKENDATNREGHAAKVYFNALFGRGFNRDDENDINNALNYGYTILLSSFNKEITSKGYITQLGINHKNEFNHFNFSCDLMEPFRPIVDNFVYENMNRLFDKFYKMDIVDLLNMQVKYCNKKYFLSNCIRLYVNNVIEALNTGKIQKENIYFIYEL